MTSPTVGLLNPLPRALAHYQSALAATLRESGAEVRPQEAVDIEVGGDRVAKARSVVAAVRERRTRPDGSLDKLLVLWPAFGYLDLALWRNRGNEAAVIFHDPLPLRPQFGLNRASAATARLRGHRPEVIVHSLAADEVLRARGITKATLLPHPMLVPQSRWAPSQNVVVLGQYKPARDLELLPALGAELRARGLRPLIKGTGWPPVEGWEVDARFLSESEFDETVRTSACLVLPYNRLFQSGVAVRAAELCVPVVGPRLSNLPWLFGERWDGLMDPGDPAQRWADSLEAAVARGHSSVSDRVRHAYEESLTCWQDWAAG